MTSLKKQLAKALERVDKDINDGIKLAAEGIAEGLVEAATVDTGLFASNYKVGINFERKDGSDFSDYGIDESQLEYPSMRLISQGEALDVAKNIPPFKLGDEIIWSNATPHIVDALADPSNPFDPLDDAEIGAENGIEIAKKRVK